MADVVNVGTQDDDDSGDPLRYAFRAVNARFEALQAGLSPDALQIVDTVERLRDEAGQEADAAQSSAASASANADSASASMAAAEAARDAAQLSSGVYATTTAGLAATTTGKYFSVPASSANDSLIMYLNSSGTAVEVKRYPSKTGLENLVANASANIRTTVDLLTAYTWTANWGLLTNAGAQYAGFNFAVSDFIPVVPGTVLRLTATWHIYGTNGYTQCLGYDEGKNVKQSLLALTAAGPSTQYVTIPAGVYWVRLNSNFTEAKIFSATAQTELDWQQPYLSNTAGQFLTLNGLLFKSNNTVGSLAGSSGTGYVPVQVGDELSYCGYATGAIYGVGLFDSNKVFIRSLVQFSTRNQVTRYKLNAVDDANVAFAVASDFSPDGTGFFTVERNKNALTKAYEKAMASAYDAFYFKTKSFPYSGLVGVSVATVNGITTLTATASGAYVTCNPIGSPSDGAYSVGFKAIKLKLTTIPAGLSTVTVQWFNASTVNGGAKVFALNDTFTLWCKTGAGQDNLQIVNASGAVFTVLDNIAFRLDETIANSMATSQLDELINSGIVFSKATSLVSNAWRASFADRVKTIFQGKRLVIFGDSIMSSYGVSELLADSLGMPMINLAYSGSKPLGSVNDASNNLRDSNLALIPADATMVVITGGVNGIGNETADVTSRDRSGMLGAINYAIDWIYTNRPNCRVLLATPPYSQSFADRVAKAAQICRDLSVYRGVPFADVHRFSEINSGTTAVTQIDGVHPSAEGVRRHAGIISAAVRSLLY